MIRKTLITGIFLSLLISGCRNTPESGVQNEHESHEVPESSAGANPTLSPHTSAMAMVGDAHVHVDYSAPGVRDRIIFGGLLAYDQLWQAGAHRATWIETDRDLIFAGQRLKAGKYGFFVIPSRENWTLIFNTRWDQHGKDQYQEAEDVLRIQVKPEIRNEITEQLTYTIKEVAPGEGEFSLAWEKVTVRLSFKSE